MKAKLALLILGAGTLVMASCTKYPPAADRLTEDLAILTQYDVTISFNQFKTFAISDSVGVITDSDTTFTTNSNAQLVVNTIVQNMESRGFTRVNVNANPDLGMNVVVFEATHVSVYYPGWYWGYGGYYPPYYWGYPGYGYGYPYYPTYVTTYSSGTLAIDLIDLKNATDGKVYIRWNAFIRALLTGDHTSTDITNAIDQAFIQTPQLATTAK